MLRELRVANLALVEDLALGLEPGLTLLTGETGAGKSLVAGALSVLAGQKAERELIRRGSELAVVEGVFDLEERPEDQAFCAQAGIRLGGDAVLVLRRELRREGRGRVLINGLVSSLSLLEQLGERLLAVQSQDQQRRLTRPVFAREFLDRVLGLDAELAAVGAALARFRDLEQRLADRRGEAEFARQQVEMWEYQHRELQTAALDPEEAATLDETLALGRNARALLEGAAAARDLLVDGEVTARQLLGAADHLLEPLAERSPRLTAIHALVRQATEAVSEAASDLERLTDTLDLDPARLDELEARKSLYAELQRKYARPLPELLELQEQLAVRIGRQQDAAADLEALAGELEAARGELALAAAALRERRRTGAAEVAGRAQALIRPLALPDLELELAVEPDLDPDGRLRLDGATCRVGAAGADRVRLLVKTNRGEAPGEVGRIASGGEMSRIYLGLSVLMRPEGESPLLLFDEIDAGLGNDQGRAVAELLARLAGSGQILCISHLPTVAARGDHHLQVAKSQRGGRTCLTVTPVTGQERVLEIARLLGGLQIGEAGRDSQLAYARELLALPRGSSALG